MSVVSFIRYRMISNPNIFYKIIMIANLLIGEILLAIPVIYIGKVLPMDMPLKILLVILPFIVCALFSIGHLRYFLSMIKKQYQRYTDFQYLFLGCLCTLSITLCNVIFVYFLYGKRGFGEIFDAITGLLFFFVFSFPIGVIVSSPIIFFAILNGFAFMRYGKLLSSSQCR